MLKNGLFLVFFRSAFQQCAGCPNSVQAAISVDFRWLNFLEAGHFHRVFHTFCSHAVHNGKTVGFPLLCVDIIPIISDVRISANPTRKL